jgi:hypothetical protein
MSPRLSIRKKPQVNINTVRLQDAQDRVSRSARRAARRMGPTSRQAKEIAANGVTTARVWSAPRIDQAGNFVEEEVGPRVGAMLHRTAGRVEPKRPRRRGGFAAMLLIIGGALGAAGAIATRRNAERSADEASSPSTADHLSAVSKNNSSSTERAHTS